MERNNEKLGKVLEKVKNLPNTPGVYKFYSGGNLVYVGKSKSLRSRVLSYFRQIQEREKINIMMRNVDDIEVDFTDTHLEARLHEFSLIRSNMPIYNAQFKIRKTEYYLDLSDKFLSINTISGLGPFVGQRFLRTFKRNLEYLLPLEIKDEEVNFTYNVISNRLSKEEVETSKEALKIIFSDIFYLDKFIERCTKEMVKHSNDLQFKRAGFFKNFINELNYVREIIIDKNNFLNGRFIFIENGFMQFIDKGELVYKSPEMDVDTFIKQGSSKKESGKTNFETQSIIYSHSKEKDVEVIKV